VPAYNLQRAIEVKRPKAVRVPIPRVWIRRKLLETAHLEWTGCGLALTLISRRLRRHRHSN